MTKSARSDTVSSEIAAMLAAAEGLPDVPGHVKLREGDEAFWANIVCTRPKRDWSVVQLTVAAQLARCQADIEAQSAMLDSEGAVLENQRGTPIANPRAAYIEQLARRQLALMRSLSMSGGDPRDQAKRSKLHQDAAALRGELADEELLAQ